MEKKTNIKALIVDDEPLARDLIRAYLQSDARMEIVAECGNGVDAVNAIHELEPDLVFLDIQMPDLNGFEVLEQLKTGHSPLIIFTTAYDQFALKAFEVNAVDYILKPFEKERFGQAIKKAEKFLSSAASTSAPNLEALLNDYQQWKNEKAPAYAARILAKNNKKVFLVNTTDIEWLEASNDYVVLHTKTEQFVLNQSLNHYESKLDPALFMRIHRSTIVNINQIAEMQPYFNGEYFVLLKNGTRLKMSRNYKENLNRISGE